jgi:hypothetical protein
VGLGWVHHTTSTFIGQYNTRKRIPRARFELAMPMSERYNTIRRLDRAATGIGIFHLTALIFKVWSVLSSNFRSSLHSPIIRTTEEPTSRASAQFGSLSPRHGASSDCGWVRPQIRRVTANILNKKSGTADKGWSSLGVWREANNFSP